MRSSRRSVGGGRRRGPRSGSQLARAAKRWSLSAPFFGRNPSKTNLSLGNPLTASAAVTALGPGTTVIDGPGLTSRRYRRDAGVGDRRGTGVGNEGDDLAFLEKVDQFDRSTILVAGEVRPERLLDPE